MAVSAAEKTRDGVQLIGVEAARAEIDSGETTLIDVREQNEWDESHLEAAIHVPQGDLAQRIDELVPDTSRRVVLYCRTDNRSSNMAATLQGLG